MVSAFKLLVFYPLWLCAILFIWTCPNETQVEYEYKKIIIGDPLIAAEITKEPKLMSRWIGGRRLVHKVTTAYVDEQKIKRNLINMDLPDGQSLPHIVTEIFGRTLQNSPQALQIETRFYANTFLYDTDYNVTFTGGRNNERFSEIHVQTHTKSIHAIWSKILRLAEIEQKYFNEEGVGLLTEEIRDQYEKKMDLIKGFSLAEDPELAESMLQESKKSEDDPFSILENAKYDL